ncbi:cyclin-e binding protein 1-like protein [Leptomonas seymouri]|uniref:Cyclin-e binding protein 1-like protein n=1 Tax=Leptomonas seymouri TaxID=5684 RepID=A0A0N1PDB4_LEPSE|nr:cyclin-e binding protein 1-like protein [Leptomonas seymouri]|eukprot:KPI86998.1 cyclin-e binding protein 1-like protein [Leptomonas seymouri]
MFSVIPTSAVLPGEEEFLALLDSAISTADAVVPHLTLCSDDGPTVECTIRKVASCQRFYSALLRSDGTLLLLTHSTAGESRSSLPKCAAHVSVLDSGGEAVKDVAAGSNHIVYCTASGAVYTCGYDNTYGQLGDGTVWSSSSPFASPTGEHAGKDSDIPALSVPKRIAGFGGTGTASFGGDSWRDGYMSRSAEGVAGDSQKSGAQSSAAAPFIEVCSPKRYVPPASSSRIRQVACGAHHTLLLTHTGRCVYACGRGDRGELGGARAVLTQPSFRSISLLFGLGMRQVAAAGAHSFALLENGLLYAFGDNMCGQLGLGHTKRVSQPTLVPLCGQEAASAMCTPAQLSSSEIAKACGSAARPVPLDKKAYISLRAPYGSAESTYYPLRVPRLLADRADINGEASSSSANAEKIDVQVLWVHCCGSWTLLETNRLGVWLSCGTALTRGVAAAAQAISGVPATHAARIDGCGVLGRPLLKGDKAEAYRFFPVQWSSLLKARARGNWDVQATEPEMTNGGTSDKNGPSRSFHAPCSSEFEGGASRNDTATASDGMAIQSSSLSEPYRQVSDTALSLCDTKKTVKSEENSDGIRAHPYATALLVLFGYEKGCADTVKEPMQGAQTGLLVSELLVQSGTPSAITVEIKTKDTSAWKVFAGCAADGADTWERTPSGASLLRPRSSHGQFIPLPTYALFL